MNKAISTSWKISLVAFCCLLGINSRSLAQVTTDGTVNTQVNQNGNVAEITGGETRGSNLFHSFQDFSVPTGNEAFFNNANDISNIFSRVTGGNISNIDGLIRANDTNLFLINPAGILFGAGARLDLGGGSFYGSSADSILFEDGEFSATDLDNLPLLTVNAPIGLNFRDNPADITVRGDGNGTRLDSEPIDTQDALRVAGDATIGFIGGNLNFESATVKTAGGRIELGSVAGGRVDLVEVSEGFSFDYSSVEAFQDISLSGTSSVIDASGNGGGNINIAGRNISINDSSGIEANTLGDAVGGDINVFATDAIEISGVENENNFISAIANRVFSNATADAGNINIETGSLSIGDRAAITTSSSGQGNAGNININASDSVSLESQGNDSAIFSFVDANGIGNGGNITIDAVDEISLSNNSGINVAGSPGGSININSKSFSLFSGSLLFAGAGLDSEVSDLASGDIVINLSEDLVLDGSNSDSLTTITNANFGSGNSGNVEVNARNITFNSGGNISSFTNSQGNIGNITLNASGDISFDGINGSRISGVSNSVAEGATGNTGDINLTAQNLNLTNGADISSRVSGTGDSGNINLNIVDTITVDGFGSGQAGEFSGDLPSQIFSNVSFTGIGNSGNIEINTQNLFLSRSGNIDTDIFGQGNAGNIEITANTITLDGTGLATLVASEISSEALSELGDNPDAEANAGNIILNTNSLSLANGAGIEADNATTGNGDGGSIQINATDSISIDGETILSLEGEENTVSSGIFASILFSETIGRGGNIEINTPQLSITNQAEVNAFTRGQGNAGSIVINVDQLSLADGSINALSDGQGDAGSISINADEFVRVSGDFSSIRAGTFTGSIGNGGDLTIETDRLFVSGGAQISTATSGQGNAGNLTINASESIELNGETENGRSGLFASALNENGNGANLQIFTGNLIIRDGATINVSNFPSVEGLAEPGTGEAGNLTIEANSLEIENDGRINAATQAGSGGNITLDIAENIILRDTGFISARALQDANGGNINIDTDFIIAFPQGDNDIIATAERGNGGNININAESLFGIQQRPLNNSTNDINASSEFSLDGTITINTPDLNSIQGEINLPDNIVETQNTVAQACQNNRGVGAQSSFTISGKGGIPNEPGLPLNSLNVTVNGNNLTSTIPAPIETSLGKIQPARGIKVTESGEIILTAYRTNNSGERLTEIKPNCGGV